MRRLLLALTVALAALAGSARADTFIIVPGAPAGATPPGGMLLLPDVLAPNPPGALTVPAALSTPPASPARLSYPQLLALWQRAGAAYGIPWQVLAAINQVESDFGRNMGPSSAGAVGWMQFLPSTWLEWGIDADGDGVADPWNPVDAVYSAARYLAAAGGAADLPRAVYAYNHAGWYVNEVLALAGLYGQDGTVAFSLDRLQQRLGAARQAVVAANGTLVAARRRLRAATRLLARRQAAERAAPLLSDRLAAGKLAALAAIRRDAVAAVVARRRRMLARAQRRLDRARRASAATAFAPGASQLLAAPSYSSSYVFPVGGGAATVSVARTHAGYPAADIAAPDGSPVYALADSVVLRAWRVPDARCGIGLTLQAFDGRDWTYCHLAYLDPGVVVGASLTAGDPVGLVGSTGDATGPHLHLQLQPPTSYPQDEPWFQRFAGAAFRWQGEPAPSAGRVLAAVPALTGAGPVFAVVPAAGAVAAYPSRAAAAGPSRVAGPPVVRFSRTVP